MPDTIEDLEKLALTLPETHRARLAASLLESLPGVLAEEDEGTAEALRRDADMSAHPDRALTEAQLDAAVRQRRP